MYLASLTRLAVSENWNDIIASKLHGLTLVVAALLALVSLGAKTAEVTPQKRWTTRRIVAVLVVLGLCLIDFVLGIIRTGSVWGDSMSNLFGGTGFVAALLFMIIGWI